MSIEIFLVDAFSSRAFGGNPAAVCLLNKSATEQWMQSVAAEMNLSETAFLQSKQTQKNRFNLRWFTPTIEVDLCGHATLASAHVLWQEGLVQMDQSIEFDTHSGLLTASKMSKAISLDFPADPVQELQPSPEVQQALGIEPIYFGRGRDDLLVVIDSQEALQALQPDYQALRNLPGRGVIVTSKSENPEFDFVSRFFGPKAGIDEDPATGSAHCTLAGYWQTQLSKSKFTAYQMSSRGGWITVELKGERVSLLGEAFTVFKGILYA